MTSQEFSNEFDILYNNIASNKAPGLDEYEKSVFLTKAQNEIVKNYFNPKSNKLQEGFDGSPKRQIDFSKLVTVATLTALSENEVINSSDIRGISTVNVDEQSSYISSTYNKFVDSSALFKLPNNLLFTLNESAKAESSGITRVLSIIPISFSEYTIAMLKPYKYPSKHQAWRLIQNSEKESSPIIEIIYNPNYILSSYKIRYVKKPTPIILTDLTPDGLSIDGISVITECSLDSSIHAEILQRAVELAKSAYIGDISTTVELGQRSE